MMSRRRLKRGSRENATGRAHTAPRVESPPDLESTDATHAGLLCRVGQSPTDQAAWWRFVALYGSQIRRWCRRWGLQEADSEDVTQDVLLRLARKLPAFDYDPTRSFHGWLWTVTQNALADFIAERKRQCPGSGDDLVVGLIESVKSRDNLMEQRDRQCDSEIVALASARAQARVEPQTWQAFLLTTYLGLSGDEAAAQLGMTRATVFKAKSRVLGFLREEVRRLDEP
jgi:RNA polymerase sigma factor (sigma-70 family)